MLSCASCEEWVERSSFEVAELGAMLLTKLVLLYSAGRAVDVTSTRLCPTIVCWSAPYSFGVRIADRPPRR